MNINSFLKSLFGDKSTRDMKLIQPFVETVKKVYPTIEVLNNDELREEAAKVRKEVAKIREKNAKLKSIAAKEARKEAEKKAAKAKAAAKRSN